MDLLDLLAAEPAPIQHDKIEAIKSICRMVNWRDGDYDISRVRPLLPAETIGPLVGATLTGLVRSGEAVWTGRYTESGNGKQRNALRPVKVYRMTP